MAWKKNFQNNASQVKGFMEHWIYGGLEIKILLSLTNSKSLS